MAIDIGIIGIKEISYISFNPFELIKNFKPEQTPIDAKLNLNYSWNLEIDLFAILVNIKFIHKEKNNNILELQGLTIRVEFLIKNLKEIFTVRSNNDFDMDENIESTLVSIAISTCRGILYEKSAGKPFLSGLIFPLVNPMDIILSKKIKESRPENNES